MAITDWALKQAAIQAALKQDEWRSVCQLVLRTENKLAIDEAVDASRKWNKSTPEKRPLRGSGEKCWREMLIVPMLAALPYAAKLSVENFIKHDIDDFIDHLTPEAREGAKRAVDAERRQRGIWSLREADPGYHRIEACTHHPVTRNPSSSLIAGVIAGMIDPHAYYSSEEGAANWTRIIRADRYPTYYVCKRALNALLVHSAWKEAMASSHVTDAFMLGGGGSPAKDYDLLLSLLANPSTKSDRVRMLLVDINPHMIAQSREGLGQFLLNTHERGRVWIQALEDDILELSRPDPVRKRLLDRPKGAVFVITGNTIGNLSELRLFTTLSGIARKGDLLIVGCGTMDALSEAELLSEDTGKYKAQEVLSFVRPGVECAMRHHQLSQTLDKAVEDVRAAVRPGKQGGLSDVPGSFSVVLTMQAAGSEIVLLRSARYQATSLTKFAEHHGWEKICIVPSPMDQNYAQFAFRFGMASSVKPSPAQA